MFRYLLLGLLALFALFPQAAEAARTVEAVFPYFLTKKEETSVREGSTQLLYLCLAQTNVPREETAHVRVVLPRGFRALPGDDWRAEGNTAETDFHLSADFGEAFGVLSVAAEDAAPGEYEADIFITGDGWEEERKISFSVAAGVDAGGAKKAAKKLGWYIQNVALPVDAEGNRDASREKDTIYVRDVQLENIRNRLTGSGGVNWSAVFSEPVTHVLVELRNPKKDSRSLHFTAELIDKETGEVMRGLVTAGGGEAGFSAENIAPRTEAVIALDGRTVQGVVVPLYADPYEIEEGEYRLRTTVSDGSTTRISETPIRVVKKSNTGIFALSFAGLCAAGVLLSAPRLRRAILSIGAGGDIAVALFASLAFGSVVVPVTLLGDFLHVLLGPFAGLVTGLLSGVLQYLLFMALLILFRRPGVAALFFLMKWLLAGVLFGRFTPVAMLSYAVYIGILETVLYASGFYRKKEITQAYAAGIALLMGACDMAITFINLQQLMFFYRLYYADWFIGLYMVVNGLLYTSIGSWLGIRIGKRLSQVMGQ